MSKPTSTQNKPKTSILGQTVWVVRYLTPSIIMVFLVVVIAFGTFQILGMSNREPKPIIPTAIAIANTDVPYSEVEVISESSALPNFDLDISSVPDAEVITVEVKEVRVVGFLDTSGVTPEQYSNSLTQYQAGIAKAWLGGYGDDSSNMLVYYSDLLWRASKTDREGLNVYEGTVNLFLDHSRWDVSPENQVIISNSIWTLYALRSIGLDEAKAQIQTNIARVEDILYERANPLEPGLAQDTYSTVEMSTIVEVPAVNGSKLSQASPKVTFAAFVPREVNMPGFSLASFVWSASSILGMGVDENLNRTYQVVDYVKYTSESTPGVVAYQYMLSSCPTVLRINLDLSRYGGSYIEQVTSRSYGNTFCTYPEGTVGTWFVFYTVYSGFGDPFAIGDQVSLSNLLKLLGAQD